MKSIKNNKDIFSQEESGYIKMQDEKSRISKSISVVLATYNGERFIIEQLDSLRKQTLQVDEVLIADDASTDNTVSIIQSYIEKYSLQKTWLLLENKINKGYSQNFIDTIKKATGKYIFLCDQDDIWVNTKIEIMTEAMEDNANINVLLAECANFSGNYYSNQAVFYQSNNPKDYDMSINYISYSKTNHILTGLGCCMCIKNKFFQEIMKYDISGIGIGHDTFLWGFANFLDSSYKINFCSIYRRCHSANTSWHGVKTLKNRIFTCMERKLYYQSLLRVINSKDFKNNYSNTKDIFLNKSIQCANLRCKFLTDKNIFVWIYYVIFYQKYISNFKSSFKASFLDLYLVIKKEWGNP